MDIQRYQDQKATKYEKVRMKQKKWWEENKALIKMLSNENIEHILDVPTGTGRFLPLYEDKKYTIIGVDASNDMLEEAKNKNTSAFLIEGNAFNLPFDDNTFDLSVCIRFLNWFDINDVNKLIKELKRVSNTIILGIRLHKHMIKNEKKGLYRHDNQEFHKILKKLNLKIKDEYKVDNKGYSIFKLTKGAI